jgi:hypothetical protein
LTPALVGKTSQFAFVAHALQQLTPLRQYSLLSQDEYHRDTQTAITAPLLHLLASPPCGFKADCHSLPHCVRGYILRALWCITMMALIPSIAISDSFNRANLLMLTRYCHLIQ